MGSSACQRVLPDALQGAVAERVFGAVSQCRRHISHGPRDVFPRSLADLDVRVNAAIVACRSAIQVIPQGQQHRGLSCLARAVQNEVPAHIGQLENAVRVEASQWRDAIVSFRNHGARGVEIAQMLMMTFR